jgi:electron transport complex protein RnfC
MTQPLAYDPQPRRPGWGVRLEAHKAMSTSRPIMTAPQPGQAQLPLDLVPTRPAVPLVESGDLVLTGQVIAREPTTGGNAVRASISGRVTAIEPCAVPAAGGRLARCIVIESDGMDRRDPLCTPAGDPDTLSAARVRELIAAAGIRGLGGALFPTAAKLTGTDPVELLILNGAECEPYITCDDMLMRERAGAVIDGARIMLRALACERAVVAVESDMPDARVALREALDASGDDRIGIAVVTAKYPAGGERQLVELLTGREVPARGLPRDIGMLCHNVATAAAVSDFIRTGWPLLSRIITVTGAGVVAPVNVEARLGTPLADLVTAAGGYAQADCQLVMGGPMMGIALPSDRLPVTEATNCLLIAAPGEFAAPEPELPCIRCAECSRVCPARLMPQDLLAACATDNPDALDALHVAACIECGCCDFVCPSRIALTPRFAEAKARQLARGAARAQAERLRRRSEAHDARLAARQTEFADGPVDAGEAEAALAALRARVAPDGERNNG